MKLLEIIQQGIILEVGFSEEGYVMSAIEDLSSYEQSIINRAVNEGQVVSVNEGIEILRNHVKFLVQDSNSPEEDRHMFAVRADRFKQKTSDFNGNCYCINIGNSLLLIFIQNSNIIQFPKK